MLVQKTIFSSYICILGSLCELADYIEMSKGCVDAEFTHVRIASCYADADYGLKPTNIFYYYYFQVLGVFESLE